jgi:mannose-6-phosphate isomerase-like protein (cupin superfamily)
MYIMPVIRNYKYQDLPKWSDMKKYELAILKKNQPIKIKNDYKELCLVVLFGNCSIDDNGNKKKLGRGEKYYTKAKELVLNYEHLYFSDKCHVMLIYGNWEYADVNIFIADRYDIPENYGTRINWYTNSGLDNHYHDFDEYWIVYEGSGVAYSEGKPYEVKAGDCLVTGIGHHHHLAIVHDTIQAIAIETQAMGQKREGHLWEHTHGMAVPRMDRI